MYYVTYNSSSYARIQCDCIVENHHRHPYEKGTFQRIGHTVGHGTDSVHKCIPTQGLKMEKNAIQKVKEDSWQ